MTGLFARAARAVRHGGFVVDIGPGIRPQELVRADRTLCIEPFGAYADRLEADGHAVLRATALEGLQGLIGADTVVMLDVIEHMDKADGQAVIELAQAKARQVVVFTPIGFMPQHGDAWGLGGDYWQAHRSGWEPEEFDGWTILSDPAFHRRQGYGAFFAIWRA